MPQPRKSLISLGDTPYYHCIARCVRRAFLCGIDQYSGVNYEHRRDWLEDKLHKTAEAFAIKLCAYAVMHNHYHVVLNVRTDIADSWSNREVVEHWHMLFSGTPASQQFELGAPLTKPEIESLNNDIAKWRKRLTDISWYMRVVNESIARQANAEDACTGRFWEGRFKSQALLDDKALIACMSYVDLNPIRAGIATSPEHSDFTCISETHQRTKTQPTTRRNHRTVSLAIKVKISGCLSSSQTTLSWLIGRVEFYETINEALFQAPYPRFLERLGFERSSWNKLTTSFESQFTYWVGQEQTVKAIYKDRKYQRIPSGTVNRLLLG